MSSAKELADALPEWTARGGLLDAHVMLDSTPDRLRLDWLAALRASGARVTWSADIPDVAVETQATPDPGGATIVLVGGSDREPRLVGDALGPLDTLASSGAMRVAAAYGDVAVSAGAQSARAAVPATIPARRALVVASAGWEAKFVVAALEERGWTVDARMLVAPGHDVVPPSRATLDTARYSVVVLLDSAATETVTGLDRFVRDGGGAVLGGDASNASTARPLVAWRAGAEESAPLGTPASDTAWRGSSRRAFTLASGAPAIVLQRRAGRPTMLARRYRGGRVVASGYDQTWRWRMQGGRSGRDEHRAWWSRVVSGAASTRAAEPVVASALSAPLASLVQMLGPPTADGAVRTSASLDMRPLFAAVALLALLAEWVLRRLKGLR